RLAELPPAARVADVACGPGTLSLLAAEQGEAVEALAVSPDMLERFQALVPAGADIRIREGDGQTLPWDDESFDRPVSTFGLILFPDRAAGCRELRRVLRPGRRAVVSSWAPRTGPIALVLEAVQDLLPGYPFGKGRAPLGDPEEMAAEMRAAGFREVRVER